MSGGSFNYLCHQDFPLSISDLESMADELDRIAPGSKAAEATRALLSPVVEVDPLREVWKAVEWWRSCDWSKGRVFEALAKYEDSR